VVIGASLAGATGLRIGIVATAFGLGFRHGIDWDHIAAITDITGAQESRRQSVVLATMYALGHALVVFVLGVLAIVLSAQIPKWLDETMGRVVGATLLALGVYVVVSLVRDGRDFRMRSRWMLVFAAARRAMRWTTAWTPGRRETVVVTHDHDHSHDDGHSHEHDHGQGHDPGHGHEHGDTHEVAAVAGASTVTTRSTKHHHLHHHVGTMPDDPFPTYGRRTAFGIGTLHGIGAETPTQVLVFLAATRVGGAASGVLLLLCFLAGLLVSNTTVAVSAVLGFLSAARNFRLYSTVSLVAATFSIVIGTLFVLGQTSVLPALGGG
jgi:high-affinity nickel-transport protein